MSSLEEVQPLLRSDSSPEEAEGQAKGTILTSVLGIFSTMAGAGILALPSTLHHLGVVSGLIVLTSMALLTWTSITYLCLCADVTHAYSYEELTTRLLGPKLIWCTRLMTFLLLFGACVMNMVIAMDVLAPLLHQSRCLVSLAFTLVVIPLCLPDSLYALRYTNALVVLCLVIFTASLGLRASDSTSVVSLDHNHHHDTVALSWITRVSTVLPVTVLSFGCQLNSIRAYGELSTKHEMRVVNVAVTTLALGFYATLGLVGHRVWTEAGGRPLLVSQPNNVLLCFAPDDVVINRARVALASGVLCKTPVTFQPCRAVLEQLVSSSARARVLTTCVFMTCVCLVANCESVRLGLDITTAAAALCLAFHIPGLCLWEVSAGYLDGVRLVSLKRPAWLLLGLGTGFGLWSLVRFI